LPLDIEFRYPEVIFLERILIVEDDSSISDLIRMNLELIGYEIVQAFDGQECLDILKEDKFDLVLLDIMLPKVDGYQIIPVVMEYDIPVLVLTAKDALLDKVRGLNLGADDYITKPFETIELIARIRVILRRNGKVKSSFSFDNIEVFFTKREIFRDGEPVELTFKEFELLKVLIENKGLALSRQQLLEMAWGYEYTNSTRTVDIHVQRLRKKLSTERITTVVKIGYRFKV